MPRAFKTLRCLVLLIALGLASSIATAWALAAWLPNSHCTSTPEPVGSYNNHFVDVTTYTRPGMIRRAWEVAQWGEYSGPLFPIRIVNDPVSRSATPPSGRVSHGDWGLLSCPHTQRTPDLQEGFDDARGWPTPCLWYSVSPFRITLDLVSPPLPPPKVHGGLLLSSPTLASAPDIRALPYLPIWKGLALNTVFYALLWATLLFTLRTSRTLLRRHRGLCPNCAYDLKHNLPAGCPECGWRRSTTPTPAPTST